MYPQTRTHPTTRLEKITTYLNNWGGMGITKIQILEDVFGVTYGGPDSDPTEEKTRRGLLRSYFSDVFSEGIKTGCLVHQRVGRRVYWYTTEKGKRMNVIPINSPRPVRKVK